ncbi:2-polyprenyl-6-methoxyphenol hydroxylase-like FAD-dependent oxidoreductase [Chryseobacterium sp. H1D6B]|uniref:FAD-dependent monooxygenase n=1 Tax=Chryseobacterium sp. H1D6B TaxID=2940588 RepID=UPI0015CD9668|nr:FAD-dependent monooxygenase [Chryseobacterium sp. H1D6B]MDH6253851.1 2-polyprenyl-6-methoxyphenol hydroxylase-like FAD-dependent oxidoreductase [Chryseobacterium sp. H1D6B]
MKTILESNKQIQDQSIYDVVISGAGPVGLFLACELALAKCSVLILEKSENPHSPLKQLPFGIRGLSAPTIEALYRRGLLEELEVHKRIKNPHQNAKQGAQRQAGHFAGIPFLEGNIDTSKWKYRLQSSTDTSLISEIEELETVLSRRAVSLGVEIKRGFAVTDFHQTEDRVTVQSNGQSFQCKWLAGCDGSRSVVRKTGGFEFAGTEPEFTGYTVKSDLADPEKLKPGRNVTARGMYMQSQPGYLMIQDFDGGAFHSSGKPLTLEHVQEVLRRVSDTDVTITALHTAANWTDRARQAVTYRSRRVLLAGDAAHIHSPLGGQGLNLGLGDAMNLGWKLAAVIRDEAPESLLDTYYNERYPIGAQVLDWSRAQVAIMKPDPSARALYSIVSDLINTHDGAGYFAGRVWGVFMKYELDSDHPLAGRSMPNFEFEDDTKIGDLMHDGKGILLDFDRNPLLKTLADEYGGKIKYVSGRAKEQLGLNALLIRPDGIVAWASDNNPDYSELQKAADRWFIRNSEAEH